MRCGVFVHPALCTMQRSLRLARARTPLLLSRVALIYTCGVGFTRKASQTRQVFVRESLSPWVWCLLGLLLAGGGRPHAAWGQNVLFGEPQEFELDESVQVEQADQSVRANLERVKACLADRQWGDAVETLRSLGESGTQPLLGITDRRFVCVRDYVQWQFARLPAEALTLYRSQMDPLVQSWYERGLATRDEGLLTDVVEQAFASSWGDDALYALGEMALERGDFAAARWHWGRIVPVTPPPETTLTTLAFPDTTLDLAAVRARLVLVSILEGDLARAREELALFERLHPGAGGRLAARNGPFAPTLRALLEEAAGWPAPSGIADWLTFAGSPTRNAVMEGRLKPEGVAWHAPLDPLRLLTQRKGEVAPVPVMVPASDSRLDAHGLCYFPVVAHGVLFVASDLQILALDPETGRPVWSDDGIVYREEPARVFSDRLARSGAIGTPRYTLTACGDRLFAKIGSPITSYPDTEGRAVPVGHLVCLDLHAQGKLVWKIAPEEGWSFEGAPVSDGASVYVAMRRSDVRPQAHVACLDAQTGQILWRRFVCSADTPAQGLLPEITQNLLTLHRDTLYYNTNLGAVAALAARDGRVRWASLYPRDRLGNMANPSAHWLRDVNPCVYHRGRVYAAPSDSRSIFGLDAQTGLILWETAPETEDAVHLLGATDHHLLASGARLYWIHLDEDRAGRIDRMFPDGPESLGFGRGLIAGDTVYWPGRDRIFTFDLHTAEPRAMIDLRPAGASGGNLFAAGGRLFIAGADGLFAMGSAP